MVTMPVSAHLAPQQPDGFWGLWTWEPSVLLGCGALLALYVWAHRGRLTRAAWAFSAGVLVLMLALVSPIDTLGDHYLFSAHMLQHLLLVLAAAPLLITGMPASLLERIISWPPAARVESTLRQPVAAWLLGVGTLWVWHIPALYNAALGDEGVHIFQHLTFLAAASAFWWPVVAPLRESRLPPLAAAGYLLSASLANALLGIYLTFTPPGLYPAYLHPSDEYGILPTIRNDWGLSAANDQQLGGLLMWVPGGLVYLSAILGVLIGWYSAPEEDEEFNVAGSHV